MRAIINMPDQRTVDGWRDYTLLLFLYNCGARVSEAAGVQWDDLQLAAPRQVRLRGKGKKERLLPLWRETADALHRLHGMAAGAERAVVFVNRHGQPLTRDGVAYILHKYASAVAARTARRLPRKRITPHVLRHSCAVALLQSGTDVTVIRDYLGHASVATTGRYITTNLQMKRDALQAFWKKAGIEPAKTKPWKPGRPACLPAVALTGVVLCGVRRTAVTGRDGAGGGPLRIKPNFAQWRLIWSSR